MHISEKKFNDMCEVNPHLASVIDYDLVTPNLGDSAFPSLEAVLRQLNDPDAPVLFKLLEQQAAIEKRVKDNEDNVSAAECTPPEPVTEFQTARLFLSHFGYLNIGGDKKNLSELKERRL
ncbi:Ral GTPase-activating protein subunit beta [Papilio machaon]|uniref:Ral GTPase-activating protein subunit beta n=1 Tax=Papilio machaon TaxID=76193 RepID=A0A0N0PF95_PAPMA|nr:Ral GTPase-activating protein subunit beta [Papilio machaon]